MQENYLKKSAAKKNAECSQKDEEKSAEDDRRNLNAKARLIAIIFCICCFCMMIFLGQDDLIALLNQFKLAQTVLGLIGASKLELLLRS